MGMLLPRVWPLQQRASYISPEKKFPKAFFPRRASRNFPLQKKIVEGKDGAQPAKAEPKKEEAKKAEKPKAESKDEK